MEYLWHGQLGHLMPSGVSRCPKKLARLSFAWPCIQLLRSFSAVRDRTCHKRAQRWFLSGLVGVVCSQFATLHQQTPDTSCILNAPMLGALEE